MEKRALSGNSPSFQSGSCDPEAEVRVSYESLRRVEPAHAEWVACGVAAVAAQSPLMPGKIISRRVDRNCDRNTINHHSKGSGNTD